MIYENRAPDMIDDFGVKEFFFVDFDYKNGCKNEFQDNNEK